MWMRDQSTHGPQEEIETMDGRISIPHPQSQTGKAFCTKRNKASVSHKQLINKAGFRLETIS